MKTEARYLVHKFFTEQAQNPTMEQYAQLWHEVHEIDETVTINSLRAAFRRKRAYAKRPKTSTESHAKRPKASATEDPQQQPDRPRLSNVLDWADYKMYLRAKEQGIWPMTDDMPCPGATTSSRPTVGSEFEEGATESDRVGHAAVCSYQPTAFSITTTSDRRKHEAD